MLNLFDDMLVVVRVKDTTLSENKSHHANHGFILNLKLITIGLLWNLDVYHSYQKPSHIITVY